MNARQDFTPIPVGKVAPKPHGLIPADFLVPARVQPDYEAMDWTADHTQTYRPARPADPDDVFSEADDEDEDVRELLAQRPVSTPNGKYVGIAMDACAALYEIVQSCRVPANYDVFSEVDVDKWAAICRRAGYQL